MDLSKYQPPEQYREPRQGVFPSRQSLLWAIRQNKDELVRAGAIVRPTGRLLIDPVAFDSVMAAVGARRAAAAR